MPHAPTVFPILKVLLCAKDTVTQQLSIKDNRQRASEILIIIHNTYS